MAMDKEIKIPSRTTAYLVNSGGEYWNKGTKRLGHVPIKSTEALDGFIKSFQQPDQSLLFLVLKDGRRLLAPCGYNDVLDKIVPDKDTIAEEHRVSITAIYGVGQLLKVFNELRKNIRVDFAQFVEWYEQSNGFFLGPSELKAHIINMYAQQLQSS